MKNIANIITFIRILLSPLMLVFIGNKTVFLVLFAVCGLSDILDGIIARKTKTTSAVGSKLDSAADFFMIVALLIYLYKQYTALTKEFVLVIIIIFAVRIFNLIFAYYKYRSFISIHTLGNKLTGILIFASPFILLITQNNVIYYVLCGIALLSAAEESIIHIKSTKIPDLNQKSIFIKDKGDRDAD